MTEKFTRRAFLGVGVGFAVATACSKKATKAGIDAPGDLTVVQASAQLLAGADQRVALALFEGRTGTKIVDHGRASFRFGRAASTLGPPVAAAFRSDGIESRPFFSMTTRFDAPGIWIAQGEWNGKRGFARLEVTDAAASPVPVPGKPMIAAPTPTTADAMGVDPICTHDPVCPLHDISLDAALKERRPLAVLFATPAFCKSQVCGPVLDVLLSQATAYAEHIRFHHVEIYKDRTAGTLAPAVQAYHLDFEPILFLADATGTVKSRLDGPFDKQECKQALDALVVA